jgi:hypothetical protein
MPPRWEQQLHRLRDAPVPLERVRDRAQQPPRPGLSLPPTRQRVIAGVIAVTIFVGVAAFAWRAFSPAGHETAPLDAPPALPASPYSLWLSADRVSPGPVELVAVLVNHGGVEATFGVAAKVDRWDGNEWIAYGDLVMCMDHWHCTARVQPPGEVRGVPAIGLSAEPRRSGPVERFTTDGLDVGWYRISQEANEGIVAAAILEVAADGSEPAPLVSVDAPAISVTPPLVSPDGGEIHVYPLIPAPSGVQSREDVQSAIRGLTEVARLERWDGSSWEAAGDVELHMTDDDLARLADLPRLTEGEYRLVREGPVGPHIGHFWVDETTLTGAALAEALGLERQPSFPASCARYVEVKESGVGYCLEDIAMSNVEAWDVGQRLRGYIPSELDRRIFELQDQIAQAYDDGDTATAEALVPELERLLAEREAQQGG